jgi:hypothetical protein
MTQMISLEKRAPPASHIALCLRVTDTDGRRFRPIGNTAGAPRPSAALMVVAIAALNIAPFVLAGGYR